MREVGAEIRRLRQERGWTGAQLAVYAGMAPSAISQIETGRRSPNAGSLEKIAKALNVEVVDLFPLAQAPLLHEPTEEQKAALNIATHWIEHLEGTTEHWARELEREGLDLEDALELSELSFNLCMLYLLEEDLVRTWCNEENEKRLNAAEQRLEDVFSQIDARVAAELQKQRRTADRSNVADLTEKIRSRRGAWNWSKPANSKPMLSTSKKRGRATNTPGSNSPLPRRKEPT